jgi:transcriptional regulator with XRE-family HTH domain
MVNCLRSLRKARGLTQPDLATVLAVNKATIIRWERGYVTIPHDMLLRLAGFFGVPVTDLVPDYGTVPPYVAKSEEVLSG